MKKPFSVIIAFAIVILFFIHLAGTLVESIYILDLMNTNLDSKVLGVLFFFSPLLVVPFLKKYPRPLAWVSFAVLLLSRGLLPYLGTANRVLASGFGTGAALTLFVLLLSARPRDEKFSQSGLWSSAGLGLAVCLSILLRTMDYGLDYSLTASGAWAGWMLGLILGWLLLQLDFVTNLDEKTKTAGVTPAILGFLLVLTLAWFVFSAPAVIARWTEGSYPLIVTLISLLAAGWVFLTVLRPQFFARISLPLLVIWNLAFTVCLTGTILVHSVPYPPASDSPAVVIGAPTTLQGIPLVLMLLLFPVIFLDFKLFLDHIQRAAPAPRQLVPGMLLGSMAVILLIFSNIFTNV